MRFLVRFASVIALVAGVLIGVQDAIRSVATSTSALTSLGAAIGLYAPALAPLLARATSGVVNGSEIDTALRWSLQLPAILVCLAASFLFWLMGYRRRRRWAGSRTEGAVKTRWDT